MSDLQDICAPETIATVARVPRISRSSRGEPFALVQSSWDSVGIGVAVGVMSLIRPNVIWVMDFQFDTTADGRIIKS